MDKPLKCAVCGIRPVHKTMGLDPVLHVYECPMCGRCTEDTDPQVSREAWDAMMEGEE